MVEATNGNGYISRGNMMVILSAAGLVMVAFGAFITLQNTALNQRIEDVKEITKEIQRAYLQKDEHAEFKLRLDSDLKRIDLVLATLVPRSTHELKWNDDEARFNRLQSDLKELRDNVVGTYSAKDAIATMQRQLDMIRERLLISNGDPAKK